MFSCKKTIVIDCCGSTQNWTETPYLSANKSHKACGYTENGTIWATTGTSAGFSSMMNLVEEFPRWVRGNLTGLSDENDGQERLACAGIRNPLTISVSTIKDIFNL